MVASSKKRLSLEERVAAVCREASLARRHFEVYRFYSEPESRSFLQKMDRYADFVLLDECAHRDLAILRATSLFDTKERTTHLPDLLQEVRERGTSPELVIEAEAALKTLEVTVKKVRLIRHNAIAHRSATVSYDRAFELANITVDELGQLVSSAEAMANALAEAVGGEPLVVALFAPEALASLFSDLHRLRQELNLPRSRRSRS